MMDFMFTTQLASPGLMSLFSITIIWNLLWKGWALWIAAKKDSKPWFIAILIINTLGILEIIYIFIISKNDFSNKEDEGIIDIEKVKEELKAEEKN